MKTKGKRPPLAKTPYQAASAMLSWRTRPEALRVKNAWVGAATVDVAIAASLASIGLHGPSADEDG